jgi:hypothetical protein
MIGWYLESIHPLPRNLYMRYELSASLGLLLKAAFESLKCLYLSLFKMPDSTAYVQLESCLYIHAKLL